MDYGGRTGTFQLIFSSNNFSSFSTNFLSVVSCHVQTCAVDGVSLLCGDGNRIPDPELRAMCVETRAVVAYWITKWD